MTDEEWMGDADPNNSAGSGADAAPPTSPAQIAPGVWAGDFVNGSGALGIRIDPAARAAMATAEPASSGAVVEDTGWEPTAPPPDGTDVYQWARHLGDQGIAYQIKDGKISVFTTPDPTYGSRAVDTVESSTNMPNQDLRHPVYQNLAKLKQALDYLAKDAAASGPLQGIDLHTPVIMMPGARDRFEPGVGSYVPKVLEPTANLGRIYWDPDTGLMVDGGQQSPAMQLFHELGHAWRYRNTAIDRPLYDARKGPADFFTAAQKPLSNGYDKLEEQMTIDGIETPVARFLGEPVRHDHHSEPIAAWTPTFHRR